MLNAEDVNKVKQISSGIGQRTFDVGSGDLTKAVINAFSNKSLTVLILEKDAGFMMAEGPQFFDDATLVDLVKAKIARFNKKLGADLHRGLIGIPAGNIRVSVNLYKKGGTQTLVKMNVTSKYDSCALVERAYRLYFMKGVNAMSYCPLTPKMTSLMYQQLWDEIEKSIFMQRETILN